jgi:hypothetical protein
MFTSVTPHPVAPADAPRSGLAHLWHQLGPGSRRRFARTRVEAQQLAALQYRWQEACRHIGLGLTVYTPSGVTVSVPRVMRADFGAPMSFTVALRPGQRAADIRAAEPRLARALGVPGFRVDEREAGWVTVVVVDPRDEPGQGADDTWDDPDDHPRPPALRVA